MVDDEQDDPQEEADGAHSDIGDAQEGVLAAHPGDCAQDHPLPPLEAAHWVVWGGQRVKDEAQWLLNMIFSEKCIFFLRI